MNKTNATPRTAASIIYQPALRPALPCVYGPVDFRDYCDRFATIDRMLLEGGVEAVFIQAAVAEKAAEWEAASAAQLQRFARDSVLALRCNVARLLTGLSFREFAVRAADRPILQWFLRISALDIIMVPAKSTLERFSKWVSEETMTQIHLKLLTQAVTPARAGAPQPLGLTGGMDLTEAFFDSTCLKANIHYPVDWVLLRDATRTLMKATVLIRREGLKQRMPQEPLQFLSDMNKLAMAMSAGRRRPDAKKQRKRVLRQMKALQRKITRHAEAHRDLLAAHWAETELSGKQTQVILGRIDNILTQLPAAIAQAHERIIGERSVPNAEKILSLYERDVEVLQRGKAGADVEFGNKLWLGETRAGLIIDWELQADAQADSALVIAAVDRLKTALKIKLQQAWGDRGLFSQKNETQLAKRDIKSGLCPRDPAELQRRLEEEPEFRAGLQRRGGTEGRIAIFKHVFTGSPCLTKGIAARKLAVSWAVLAHNLWVLARLKLAQDEAAEADAVEKAA